MKSSLGLDDVIERAATMEAAFTRAIAGVAAAALRWWMLGREALSESEYAGSPAGKPYVGLHTPDSDAAGVRIDAAAPYVDPIAGMRRSHWG